MGPAHEGYLTTGDNEKSNGCRLDQLRATDSNASDQYIRSQGLKDQNGNPVLAVKDEWVIGVASTEIPWLGSIKLLTTGAWPAVPNQSWTKLSMLIGVILVAPVILDAIRGRLKNGKQYRTRTRAGRIVNYNRLSDPQSSRFSRGWTSVILFWQ